MASILNAALEDEQPIRIGGALLREQRHICAFFNSHDEEYRLLLPFIKEGFDCGDKAVHIIDPARGEAHLRQLRSVGIDVAAAQNAGQLDLRGWPDAHLRDGYFDQDRTLALIEQIRQRSKEQGFQRIRFVTHMEWAFEDRPGVDGLLEYEAKANLAPLQDPVVCVYDLAKVSGGLVIDIMRTHPVIIIGGVLQENPFFVPPLNFLRELRARRSQGTSTDRSS